MSQDHNEQPDDDAAPSTTTTTAQHPFDDEGGDVVIRSADNVDFFVHKLVLSLASPFFHDMFSLPHTPEGATLEGRPIIAITEDSTTADLLFRLIYPIEDPRLDTLDTIQVVMEAGRKYIVDAALRRGTRAMMRREFLEREPMRVFATAYRYGLEEETRAAARCTLRYPLIGKLVGELEHIPAAGYHRLLEYHRVCADAALGATTSLLWSQNHWIWFRCSTCTAAPGTFPLHGGQPFHMRSWFANYLERVRERLKEAPHSSVIAEPVVMAPALEMAGLCHSCRPSAFLHLMAFAAQSLGPEIDKVTSKVRRGASPSDVMAGFF